MFEELPRPGLWKRLLIGGLLVIFASAGAAAVTGFHEVDKVVAALKTNEALDVTGLAETDPGDPQTLMILGSDRRPKNNSEGASGARSDTIILVRMDPDKDAISMMSLPRDLKVDIPGYGTDKLNAAYSEGGARRTLKTVRQLTGLPINHVVEISFKGFWRAVNAIGCVYVDVDRDYFNDSGEFSFIDIDPGYQRLCARKALQYVRYRHTDTDIVRAARQQDFLRQARQQFSPGDLIAERNRLLKIFGRNTQVDKKLQSRSEILRLAKLAIGTAGHPIREVRFQGDIDGADGYVISTPEQIASMVEQFRDVEKSSGPRGKASRKKGKRPRETQGIVRDEGPAKDQAVQAVGAGAGPRKGLPVMYPTVRTSDAIFPYEPRVYKLPGDGKRHLAYRMVIQRPNLFGEYYGIQGTTWKDPPILRGPQETRKFGGRTYELHFDGDRLRLVAWRTNKAAYWVSNTLLISLSNRQMMAIARSTRTL